MTDAYKKNYNMYTAHRVNLRNICRRILPGEGVFLYIELANKELPYQCTTLCDTQFELTSKHDSLFNP